MKNVFLVANPVAGGYSEKKMKAAVAAMESRGWRVTAMVTSGRGDAEAASRGIAREGLYSLVFAAGGDGTYNEVANGLALSDTPMAVLPLGTKSVLARELRMPQRIEDAVDMALSDAPRPVHLGRITCRREIRSGNSPSQVQGMTDLTTRFFLLMAGFGYDGDAVYGTSAAVKKYTGQLAYILSGLSAFLRYNPSPLTITAGIMSDQDYEGGTPPFSRGVEEGEVTMDAALAIVGKASCYGGDYTITPQARLTDPVFSVFVARGSKRMDLLRYVSAVILKRPLAFEDTGYVTATTLSVEGTARIQIDGDYAGVTPATVEVVPNALRLVCPAGYGA